MYSLKLFRLDYFEIWFKKIMGIFSHMNRLENFLESKMAVPCKIATVNILQKDS